MGCGASKARDSPAAISKALVEDAASNTRDLPPATSKALVEDATSKARVSSMPTSTALVEDAIGEPSPATAMASLEYTITDPSPAITSKKSGGLTARTEIVESVEAAFHELDTDGNGCLDSAEVALVSPS